MQKEEHISIPWYSGIRWVARMGCAILERRSHSNETQNISYIANGPPSRRLRREILDEGVV